MEQQERALIMIASRLLTYPDDNFSTLAEDIKECMEENISLAGLREELDMALKPIFHYSLPELQKLYVTTFDLKANQGLYLTAHELGDSNKRGAALIKLQKVINKAGFERVDDELADYMPMLFEFLAAAPDNQENKRLVRRLAVAIHRIMGHLPASNPYYNVLAILMAYIFPEPTKAEIEKLEFEREEADLEELPYPIMYN
ncbi:nitrate reductase molybdenum cofactor assembly chaperone [Virgibacillus dakarensis]|uniref:Nitrate reductase molybdenum cofactor assembly chaperone n=1 Tax=Lentibacillus populi TaxID=1827502 RepID=A0A9W5U292_9BACI|nr:MULTISPECIES: nitrate reductase molybdenum cofactor assembly chaperone [Bacillaceae]MTW88152.1 nitrate reductase molybdenum cofactor assembly chaperone [Virgibacillus dakarensis]GGB60634.1 nitrate reductase molybdenum cofactor assembly chaperone [Lentibacillus populi]